MDGRHGILNAPSVRRKALMPNWTDLTFSEVKHAGPRLVVSYLHNTHYVTHWGQSTHRNGFNELKELEPSSVTFLIRVTTGVKGVDSTWTYRNGLCSFSLPGRAFRTPSCTLKHIYMLYIYLLPKTAIVSIHEIFTLTCFGYWEQPSSGGIISQSTRCLTLILRRSRTGTVWFYTSTSNKRAARPKLYTKSLTRDLKLMYSRLTLVRISINL